MTRQQWQRIQQIFDRAVEMDGARRSAFLDMVCAGDPGLRRDVEGLLASDQESGTIIRPFLVDKRAG